jgi:hypothetical protein
LKVVLPEKRPRKIVCRKETDMLLNNSLDSKKSLNVALLLLTVGLLALICGITWQHAFAPVLHLKSGPDDFFHGFSIGLGLTLECFAVVILVRIGSKRSKQ